MKTYIELSKYAFENNINQIKQIIKDVDLSIVVKSNAYGHGLEQIGQLAKNIGQITCICTAGINEAIRLRNLGLEKSLLALSYIDDQIDLAIHKNIQMSIYDIKIANMINEEAKKNGKKALVHIKIDTGMSRLGILPEYAIDFIQQIKKFSYLEIIGIFTHLSDPHDPNSNFAYVQLKKFDDLIETLNDLGINISYSHAISSSGLNLQPSKKYKMVRAGGFIYGLWKTESLKQQIISKYPNFSLLPIMQWKTKLISVKKISTNNAFNKPDKTIIGILPIGYFDGYNINLDNKGFVIINDQIAPIIGKINMNLISIDLSKVSSYKINDEVFVLGNQEPILAQNLASEANTIPNQIVTRINPKISRKII